MSTTTTGPTAKNESGPTAKKESRFRKTVKKIREFFGKIKNRIVKTFTRKRRTSTAVPKAPVHIALPKAVHIAEPTVVKTSPDRHSLSLSPEKEKTPRSLSLHSRISTPSSSKPSTKKTHSDYKSAHSDEYILAPSPSMQTKKFKRTIFNKKNRRSRIKINKNKSNVATIPKLKMLNRTICKKNDRLPKRLLPKLYKCKDEIPKKKSYEYHDVLNDIFQTKQLYRIKKGHQMFNN
jgi:hypothetical protein